MVAERRMADVSDDRLNRVAAMLNNAVDLLNQAMAEIKGEEGDDDGDAASPPDGDVEQPG